jgi:hypothetical protein
MDLLFRRSQHGSVRTYFQLWACLEVPDEEMKFIKKYNMQNAILVSVIQPGLLRNSLFVGFVGFWLSMAFVIFAVLPELRYGLGLPMIIGISSLVAVASGYIYYHQARETILVNDILHGRTFKCHSVIELARKEAYIQSIVGYFRQVVESAKHWDGTESIKVEPLPPEEAKRFILSGPLL